MSHVKENKQITYRYVHVPPLVRWSVLPQSRIKIHLLHRCTRARISDFKINKETIAIKKFDGNGLVLGGTEDRSTCMIYAIFEKY